ncbi:MAG: CBS domain-containing protein [Thermoprotei archaeon]
MLIDNIPSISMYELLRELREQPILIKFDDIIIERVLYLAGYDKEALIIIDDKGLYKGIVSGYDIIRLFYLYDKNALHYMFKTRMHDIMRVIITTNTNDSLRSLIRKMIKTKFGMAVIVDENNHPVGLVGMIELLKFYLTHGVYLYFREMQVQNLASRPLIEVSRDSNLRMVISLMINKNVRRIFVRDIDKVITDRSIIQALFLYYFQDLLEKPEEILNKPVNELSIFQEPAIINVDVSVEKVIRELLNSEAKCIINKDSGYIITPWDLVIKPFQFS